MSCMWPRRSMALVAMLLMQSSFSAASWCQADVGSCIGELHAFEEHACGGPMIEGSWRGKGFSGNGITHQHLFRFADWDGDGDMDLIVGHYMNTSDPWDKLQIEFHERLPSGALQAKPWHTVESTPEVKAESFEVVDWDGDQKMDLLLCIRDESRSGSTRVFWYNHSVLETEGTSPTGSVIVSVDRSTSCDLRAVDFDEDGDVDLFVGQEKYFERVTPTKLVERTENPLAMFDGQLVQLVDIDGDGHLDVIQRGQRELLFFRRSLDGRFIEPLDNPLTGIIRNLVRSVNIKASDTRMDHILRLEGFYHRIVHVADWDSDGLPDLFQIEFGHDDPNRWGLRWECQKYYRHVVNRDLKYNSHFTSYEDIETSGGDARSLQLIDWNKDGWDDVMVQPNQYSDSIYLYEVNEKKTQKVSGVLDKVKSFTPYDDSLVLLDWDADGNMDLIATSKDRLVFYQMVSGKFQANPDHPLSQFRLTVEESDRRIVPVDWDQDGDMDLFVIQIWNEKRQYFEQQHDGSVKERSIEFGAPFESLMLSDAWVQSLGWHFLDCDGDGDMDLVRSRKHGSADYYLRLQACEHKEDGSLHCDDDFRCLGTDFSLWNPSAFAGFGMAVAIGVGSEDGRLKILAAHQSQRHPVLWTAGFCKPSDSCNQKGTCIARQVNCECNPGYESKDCSRCEPQYYTASLDGRHMRSCEECPGEVGGQVCYGRGRCFDDDVAAKAVTEAGDYTATLTATGNGSCLCSEADFYGVDEDGRTTCVDGFCPAGTEERDGGCYPCDEGSSSLAGLPCTKCPLGTYSEAGNSSCLECPPGTISDSEGASACDACLAGKYEVKRQSCADCTVGTFSFAGDGSCTKCSAGTVAPKQGGSTCALCPRGKYSQEGSARCDPCPRGTVSESGSGNCSACDAGRFSQDLLTCEPCPGGTFAPRGSPKCQQCSQGKYSGIGSESCRDCPPGTISNSQGASECVRCPPGRGEFNRQACIDCPVGTISFGGNGSCTKCSAGTVAPKQGGSTCDRCPEGTYSEEAAAKCTPCDPGTVASAASGNCSECTAGRFSKDLTTCEQCPAGKYASLRSFQCTGCPSNHVAKPGSGKCESCESRIIRSTPDATKQSCQPESMDLILAVISAIASSCFCFLCLLGFHGRIALADISAQGEKNVITTVNSHFLMKSWCPQVTFAGTGVPHLDGTSSKVKALSSFQLTLHGKSEKPLDTSMGHVTVKFPRAYLQIGLWRCPLLGWCLLFGAAAAAAMIQLEWSLILLVAGLGILVGGLAFVWRQRQGRFGSPLSKRHRQFLRECHLPPKRCERGPDRSMTAGQLHDFVQYFETFIKDRSMYYVCANIVQPLTKPFQVSFVELVGPSPMEWFVSHYWGMGVRHFNDAIRKHAESFGSSRGPRGLAYWVCTFSNSQWHVKAELGDGNWKESSFYLALKSPLCRGTAMIIDENVYPLQRIWCLFEVYHTIQFSQSGDHFQGLLLCTSTGVLQEGRAGTDVAVKVGECAKNLDTRAAEASNEKDKAMIHELIKKMEGGFDGLNKFVRETIWHALKASHQNFETTFRGLEHDLTSAGSQVPGPGPTLLTRQSRQSPQPEGEKDSD